MPMIRREFMKKSALTTLTTSLAVGGYHVAQADSNNRVKFSQIGTRHAHASGKIGTARKFKDHYEVVGVVEPDDERWNAAARILLKCRLW